MIFRISSASWPPRSLLVIDDRPLPIIAVGERQQPEPFVGAAVRKGLLAVRLTQSEPEPVIAAAPSSASRFACRASGDDRHAAAPSTTRARSEGVVQSPAAVISG